MKKHHVITLQRWNNLHDPGDIGLTETVAKFNKAKIEGVYFGMKPMSSVASFTKID